MNLTPEQLMQLIKGRRSIRRFRPQPVENDLIEKLIEAAVWAPSAGNRQSYRFLIISSRTTIQKLTRAVERSIDAVRQNLRKEFQTQLRAYLDNFTIFRSAPVVLAPIYRNQPSLLQKSLQGSSQLDLDIHSELCSVSAAIMNVLLYAHSLSLGTCWMTGPLLARREIENILSVPKTWRLAALIPLGYPDEAPSPPPRRRVTNILMHYTKDTEERKLP